MTEHGILVDFKWCSGCRSCEVACQMEHNLPVGHFGVKVFEVGPWQIEGEHWQHDYQPLFTSECDLCQDRVTKNKLPSCVQHCQAGVLEYGKVEDLAAKMNSNKKQSLQIP